MENKNIKKVTYDDVINLAQRKSLFYPTTEIYDAYPAGFFDFGPYGTVIKRKIVDMWRRELVKKEDFLEIDGAILMPEDVFNSSGHLKDFKDPITKCTKCKSIFRADKILEENVSNGNFKEAMSNEELTKSLREHKIVCQNCKGHLSDVEKASLMVETKIGISKEKETYLRPETCQSIFMNFLRMTKTMRLKLPKGISQFGKAYRNEISPRQTLLRTIEFTQMETEIFFDPDKINEIEGYDNLKNYEVMIQRSDEKFPKFMKLDDLITNKIVSGKLVAYYLARTQQLFESYGFKRENMRFRELDSDEIAFYAKEAFDFEVLTSLGWVEIIANNYRTDYDLKGHQEGSKKDLRYTYDDGTKILPHIYEVAIGTDRTFYAVIENSMRIEAERTYLSLPNKLAPVEISVFPLSSNKPELVNMAKEIYKNIKTKFDSFYDDTGSIGKRYARMDEIGCPYCVTIDFDSLEDNTLTIRDRDTTEQKRIKINKLKETLTKLIDGDIKFSEI